MACTHREVHHPRLALQYPPGIMLRNRRSGGRSPRPAPSSRLAVLVPQASAISVNTSLLRLPGAQSQGIGHETLNVPGPSCATVQNGLSLAAQKGVDQGNLKPALFANPSFSDFIKATASTMSPERRLIAPSPTGTAAANAGRQRQKTHGARVHGMPAPAAASRPDWL